MSRPTDDSPSGTDQDWVAFSALDQMVNHWDRPWWKPGRAAYYWYLTFDNEHELHDLAHRCQRAVGGPHLDLVGISELHMTLEGVGFVEDVDPDSLDRVKREANSALQDSPSFTVEIGPLAGSSGALSFSAAPRDRISSLRADLVEASHTAGLALGARADDTFRPHVGIAYCNQSIPAQPLVEQVRSLRTLPTVEVCIREVFLVALTRNERSYTWDVAHHVPLAPAD